MPPKTWRLPPTAAKGVTYSHKKSEISEECVMSSLALDLERQIASSVESEAIFIVYCHLWIVS